MGFDNECILNIQSLAGEYFCPVCRLLVYPNEAMQSQCTHLYCKPCLTYVVGTTRACPYDGYLVTEADSKPLTESNKALADTIGKIAVHCLYHRSGCTWQGQLSECTTHCAGCAFGNSPVVCNRCGTQIVHRQVQEHAQNCPGAQPQTQQAEGSQDATGATTAAATATTEQNQATLQAGAPVSQGNTAQVAVAPSSAQNATQVQPSSQPQAVPTQEQLYQQQFQQYYQQYPGYDPYQQQYQHYDPYQQQVYQQQQMQAHIPQAVQGQQPQVYMQAQSQPHQQPQPQLQSQTPIRPQSQPQPQTPIASQPQMQAQVNTHQQLQFAQSHPQMTPQTHPQLQGHQQPQVYPQPHPNVQPPSSQHQVQSHLQPRPQVPQHQQPHPQVQHPHPHTQPHPLPQPQHHSNVQPQPQPPSQSQPQVQPQTQPQPQTQAQPHAHPQAQPHAHPQAQPPPQPLLQAQHPPVHAVTGHQSYPQVHQQMPLGMVQQHPVHMHPQMQVGPQQLPQDTVQMQGQFPLQQLPHMRPPQSHAPMQQQQQPAMFPPQGQRPNMPPSQQLLHPHPHPTSQPIHQHPDMLPSHQQNVAQQQVHGHLVHSQVFPGQAPGLGHTQPPQPNLYMQQQGVQSLPRPQGSAFTLPHAHRQLQQNVPISRGLPHQSQSVAGPPVLSNHAVAHQPFQMPSNGLAHAKLMPSSAVQPYPIRTNSRPQSSALPTSPVPQSGAKAQVSSNMKPELQAEAATQKTDTKDAQGVDLVTTRAENKLKSVEGEKSISEDKGKSSHLESDDKEISESSHALEKDPVEKTDEPVIKQMVKDEATTKLDPSTAAKDRDGVLQIKQDHEEPQGQADVHKKLLSQQAEILDRKVQKDVADQQLAHSVSGAVAPSQTVGTSHSVLQNVNLQDRNLFNHQFPHQGIGQMHGSSFPRPGQAVSLPDNQQLSGPPHMLDRNQRPPGPDQMLLPSMAPPHQMQVPGQLSAHMRPQGHNLIPPQGNPSIPPGHFQQPIGKQLPGSFGPSVGSHNQGHMPPPHVAGHRRPSESISGPLFGGPPPGAFDSQGGIMSRGPPHGSEGQQIPGNPMDAELLANGRVGYFDGRQSDSHLPGPRERVPFGQSSSIQAATLKTNGGPGKGRSGGLHDPSFPYLPEERFKSFPLDPGRHIIDRRDFQEDLKQFPRPSHLEGEPGSKFDSFFSSSRPLGLHLDGSAGAGTSRLRPPFQTGGSGPMGVHNDFLRSASDSSRVRMDGLLPIRSPGREFPGIPSSRFLRQEDIEGRGLESRLFGDRSKPLSFPSDGGAFLESRFPMLPSHMHRGDPDGPGSLRISEPIGSSPLPIHLRAGEPLGLRTGLGAFPNHLRSGDVGGPGNLPLNLRIDESIGGHFQPGFGGSIPVHGYPNDGGFFNAGDDHSRKRKVGSMGWCRICKVDCETVEGLDLHSQTRDHQKKAMDMVQNIKKDNAKKQKISSDDNAPQEDTNKSRKASFESRGN